MMRRTHLAITFFFILLFLPHVSYYYIFIPVALIATLLPDIDSGFSSIGRIKETKIVRFFSRHRGFFHSLTFCILVSVFFALFIPILALPFFLGYSLHLLADSFTVDGIKPFWPISKKSEWVLRTGSKIENILFYFFIVIDFLVFILVVKSVF